MMYEDAYQVAYYLNPLYSGCPPDVGLVRELFERDPDAAKFVDFERQTLLHRCVAFCPRMLELIQLFCESYPEALHMEDVRGKVPLELFITEVEHKPLKTLQYLVQKGPEALIHENARGQFPLHCACTVVSGGHVDWPRDSRLIDVLIQGFPDAVSHPDNAGRFPLHLALEPDRKGKVPTQAIEALIEQAPNVLRESVPNNRGQLPLHTAVASHWACSPSSTILETVQLLADKFPRALLLQDAMGKNTPLMDACVHDRPLNIVYSLVRQWPEQITVHQSASLVFQNRQWNGEMLPILMASESSRLSRVQQWAQLHPQLLQVKDGMYQRLPLHYAAASKSTDALSMVHCLVKRYPQAVSVQDAFGRLPLHYAVLSKSHDARFLVNLLIQHHPRGMTTRDKDGLLPWHYAECANANFGSLVADPLYEQTSSYDPDADLDGYLVPDEVRWDIVQVCQESLYDDTANQDYDQYLGYRTNLPRESI